jgi:hypothetical protein
MNEERLKSLVRELESTCANEKEAQDFALFATNLSNAFKHTRSQEIKNNFLAQIRPTSSESPFRFQFLLPVILALIVVFGFTYKVQASQEGEFLYPVKLLSAQVYNDAKEALSLPIPQAGNINVVKDAKPGKASNNSTKEEVQTNKTNSKEAHSAKEDEFTKDTSDAIQNVGGSIKETVSGTEEIGQEPIKILEEKVQELVPTQINLPQNNLDL